MPFIIIFAAIVFGGGHFLIKKTFEYNIKQKIIPVICECIDNLKWNFGEYNLPFVYKEANLINYYDNYYFENIFSGVWKKRI